MRTSYQGRRNVGNGAGAAGALDPDVGWQDDRLNADLTYYLEPQLTQYWDVTAQLSYFSTGMDVGKTLNRIFPPGAFGGAYPDGFIGNPGIFERHTRFDLSGFYSRFSDHLIRAGSGYYYGDLYKVTETKNFGIDPQTGEPLLPGASLVSTADTPFVFIPEKHRKNSYVFLQDVWKLSSSWELTTGIRYDKYSDFGSTVNPRAAIVWQTSPALTTKLLYGNAFRAPSIAELYISNNPAQLGNPNLKPESIETWEIAGDYRATRDLHLALNFFTYKITDKIVYVPDLEVEGARAQNAGSQEGRGLEFELRWKPTIKSSVLFNYAFQDSVDENDHLVAIAPRHSGYLRADWLVTGNWFLDANVNWVADRPRAFDDPRPKVDDYAIVNLSLRYKDLSRKDWDFALGVRNVFDTDAREPSDPSANIPNDLPLAGRSYYLEVRYHF